MCDVLLTVYLGQRSRRRTSTTVRYVVTTADIGLIAVWMITITLMIAESSQLMMWK